MPQKTVITIPKEKELELKRAYSHISCQVTKQRRMWARHEQLLADIMDLQEVFEREVDAIHGSPLDWEMTCPEIRGNRLIIHKVQASEGEEKMPEEPNSYLKALTTPPIFKGYARATGEALCVFKFNSLTEQFEWFALVPEEKWTCEEAESVCRYLEHLNANREELMRPVRIRPAETEKP